MKPAPRKVMVGDEEVREEEKGEAAAAVPARTEAERIEEAEVLLRTEAEAAARLRAAVRRRREFISLLAFFSFFSSGIELQTVKSRKISAGRQDATQRGQMGMAEINADCGGGEVLVLCGWHRNQ